MSGNDNIKKEQGAIKLEEIRLNKPQEVIEAPEQYNALIAFEQLRKIAQDSLRRAGLILSSTGPIQWDGDKLLMQSGGEAFNIELRLLQNEAGSARTINLILQGTLGAASSTEFDEIVLEDGAILYLQLNRETVLAEAAASLDGSVIIENQVNGGSIVSGKTALKSLASKTTGVPFLSSAIGANSDTFNIPIAIVLHRTVGAQTIKDLWWIPHGIRWPQNTISTIGAVIVEGQDVYPSFIVSNEVTLIDALGVLSTSGGVIVLNESFSISQQHIVPSDVKIIGRKEQTILSFAPGGQLVLSDDSELLDLYMAASSTYSGEMVLAFGNRTLIERCKFDITDPLAATTAIQQVGSNYKFVGNLFVNTATTHTGIQYTNTNPGVDVDSQFI